MTVRYVCMIRMLVAACVAVSVTAAAAAPVPRLVPQHDVTVTYDVSGAAAEAVSPKGAGGAPVSVRLQWSAGQNRLLAAAPGRPQRFLIDVPGHQAVVLDDTARTALILPMRETDVQATVAANARFTRRGQETVAGETCTVWAVDTGRGAGTVCLTEDGVPLRGEGDANGRHSDFVATAVDHGRVDPADVAFPAGYNRIELPRFGGR